MWKILAMVVVTILSTIGNAQSQNQMSCALPKLDPKFGAYGYRHLDLHHHGVIDKLIEQSGHNCCDGGKGGECRVTTIVRCGTRIMAWLDGNWCPLNTKMTIFTNIALPQKAFAVVCASQTLGMNTCPSSYCAAEAPGL